MIQVSSNVFVNDSASIKIVDGVIRTGIKGLFDELRLRLLRFVAGDMAVAINLNIVTHHMAVELTDGIVHNCYVKTPYAVFDEKVFDEQ